MKQIEQTIDSREVAGMMGKEHKTLLKDIRRYNTHFTEGKIAPSEFWTESKYEDSTGRTLPCYNITKKGCEFIAHKLTGAKGTVFTARYINRFHEMEDAIRAGIPMDEELPTCKKPAPFPALDEERVRKNWFNYMLTALEKALGLTRSNMLHQSYESMKNDGMDLDKIKAQYEEETGNICCSTFDAVCNDRVAAFELAELLCRNMEIVFIKRCLST